jgi:hypothetical protein
MSKRVTDSAADRARRMAAIARELDERKKQLAYGEFERWAAKAHPEYPIQVLRYLRKAHRVFGRDLPRLLEKHGQKKVFLLLCLDDPWAPLREGIRAAGREGVPLTELSVTELRAAVRPLMARGGAGGWGGVAGAIAKWSSLWPRIKRAQLAIVVERASGARAELERFRAQLAEAVGHLDEVLGQPRRKPARPGTPFLD